MPVKPDYPELASARLNWRFTPADNCLAEKVILVTGAGDGIGRASAKTFATFGAHVVLLGRTRAKLEAVFDWITTHTRTEPVIVPCDLLALDEESAHALRQAIDNSFGRLDGIVHNASMLGPKVPIAHYPADQFQQVLQVNAFAPFLLTQVLLPVLEKSPSASIVMISSSVGRAGRAYWGAYAVSKFALEGLTQVLADEHSHAAKIRINSLNPGGTRTAMRRAAYPAEDPATLPTPEDRLDVALYLMTDLALGITGEQFDARSWDGPVDKNVF
ncbi:MAG: YciK family oxidoreductase [Gammaproteobacteria bacterium]|nr:YciK family oxidoreductase [Gammaproteobacteria bacterium]